MSEQTPTNPASNPFAAFALPGAELWRASLAQGFERARAAQEEWAKAEAQGVAHARTVVEESARLMNETLTWGLRMTEAWRDMWLEGARKVAGPSER
ncbi:MAG: hypothetical protein R3A52_03130 [Polyangiales bacterium]